MTGKQFLHAVLIGIGMAFAIALWPIALPLLICAAIAELRQGRAQNTGKGQRKG